MTIERFALKTTLVLGTAVLAGGPAGLAIGVGITAADLLWGKDFDNVAKGTFEKVGNYFQTNFDNNGKKVSSMNANKMVNVRQQPIDFIQFDFIPATQDNTRRSNIK